MLFLTIYGVWYILIFILDLLPLFKRKKYPLFSTNIALLVIAAALQFSVLLEIKLPSMTAIFIRAFDYLFLS